MSKKVKKLNLLCDDNDDAESGSLTINKDYADRYDNWRRLEEMQRLKDKYGDEANEEGDTDSTSSEEVEWTADDEKSFLKTFAALKTKNPKIYNTEEKFFVKKDDASTSKVSSSKEKKDKPMFLKDYERKLITEHGGQISEDEDNAGFEKPKEGGYFAEQERLKKEFKMALGDSEGEESEEDLLTKRVKTEEEHRKEDEDFYDWLKGKGSPVEMDEDIKALRDEWSNNEKLDADEKFLRNYIVNKQYEMEADEDAGIPTYDEIVTVEQDQADMEREEQFEHKYNYRYEEPDQEFIKQYPRTIKESMRKGNEKRKEQRVAYKERKEHEKTERKEEIKQLRKMKRSEIEDKLKKLKKMAGDDDLAINLDDLDEDFDPTKYDKRMKEIYSDKYYENDDVEDEEKPEFSDMSDVDSDGDDNYDDMEIGTKPVVDSEEEEAEAPEAAPSSTSHFREKKEGRRRKKRNSKFADAVKREKPLFDPKEKTFEEYFNEYYSLDYEDILGDTRTKFHYRPVPANSFGLTVDEILTTEDKRLNAWVSLRKATQYRTEQEESFDQRAYERKAQNAEKKHKILSDLPQKPKANVGPQQEDKPAKTGPNEEPAQEQETEAGDVEEKTGKKRRRRNKNKNAEQEGDTEAKDVEAKEELEEVKEEAKEALKKAKDAASQKSARTRKRKHKSHEGGKGMKRPEELENISDERLQAYGLNPKKFVNKFHHQKKRKQEQQMA